MAGCFEIGGENTPTPTPMDGQELQSLDSTLQNEGRMQRFIRPDKVVIDPTVGHSDLSKTSAHDTRPTLQLIARNNIVIHAYLNRYKMHSGNLLYVLEIFQKVYLMQGV